jgi:hypothetical protein
VVAGAWAVAPHCRHHGPTRPTTQTAAATGGAPTAAQRVDAGYLVLASGMAPEETARGEEKVRQKPSSGGVPVQNKGGRTLAVASALRGSSDSSSSTTSSCECQLRVSLRGRGVGSKQLALSRPMAQRAPSAPLPRWRAPERQARHVGDKLHVVGVRDSVVMAPSRSRTTRALLASASPLPTPRCTPPAVPYHAPPGPPHGRTPPWLGEQTWGGLRRRCAAVPPTHFRPHSCFCWGA